jgi:hypothetical protein
MGLFVHDRIAGEKIRKAQARADCRLTTLAVPGRSIALALTKTRKLPPGIALTQPLVGWGLLAPQAAP